MSSFKALRVAGEHHAYLYTVWCTNELELYNTINDPDELINLALNPDAETRRLMTRLNALLLVVKSCEGDRIYHRSRRSTARSTRSWTTTSPPCRGVHFDECLQAQVVANERPFFPESAAEGLGTAWRVTFDDWSSPAFRSRNTVVEKNEMSTGTVEQRNVTYVDLLGAQRNLTSFKLYVVGQNYS
ncbi:hypothetical protein MCOR25_009839 [Pyricularia grisea]|nr:hypothetical protein MCOR25_009839 [Pyricularia grisea]